MLVGRSGTLSSAGPGLVGRLSVGGIGGGLDRADSRSRIASMQVCDQVLPLKDRFWRMERPVLAYLMQWC